MFPLISSPFRSWVLSGAAVLASGLVSAQVSSYTFSQAMGTWQPIAGAGTPLGMPGLPAPFTFDDNSFVTQGESLPLGSASTGNGWLIGFTFHFNGQAFDRVGLSMEGWLAFGSSADGAEAVYVPVGSTAYTPLSSPAPAGLPALMRNRVAGFANDLAAMGNGGTWPLQIQTSGVAPDRTFVAEWNVFRSGTANLLKFQIRLNEGGGDPAAQTVQVVYGGMPTTGTLSGQVGLGGSTPTDFNNRSITVAPYDWMQSNAGTANNATCRLPSSATNLPQGLTYTWTPSVCGVSGIEIMDLLASPGGISANLSWLPTSGATSYDYVITTGAATDTPVLSGNGLSATQVQLTGLPANAQLFAYVRANCGTAGTWSSGLPFSTEGAIAIICGEQPLQTVYCYSNYEQRTWTYSSSSAAPLRAIFHAGTIGLGDLLTCYDGPNDQSPLLFTSASGPVAGQTVNSTGGNLTIRIQADDLSSCENTTWLDPLDWEVGCLDCQAALVNFTVVPDCANDQYSVQANVFSMGSATSLTLINDRNSTTVPIPATGSYSIGPFPKDSVVVVTAQNPANSYCSAVSLPLVNGPCAIQSCGPDNYTYCYTNNDPSQWLYQSIGGQRIGIRFRSGTVLSPDAVQAFDGSDPFMSSPLFSGNNGGDLRNLLITTSVGNSENALLLAVSSNNFSSCTDGAAQPWNYVVACYDGCSQPQAGFTVVDDCVSQQFSVAVAITDIGSSGAVTITNDGGAASVPATAAGNYTVGPFPVGTQVRLEVEGGSKLCSWTSPTLTDGCGNIGIAELQVAQVGIYPNPNNGVFKIVPPTNMGGMLSLNILDVAGRTVFTKAFNNTGEDLSMDLTALTGGAYAVILSNNGMRATGQLRIVR
ncbi:MAG: T9SS type A sorting domain-containing protein [Flavobacteriales bacterium]